MTGPADTFKYYKVVVDESKQTQLVPTHTQINSIEEGRNFSQNYTCHAWSEETTEILVCTDEGEMLICNNDGDYRAFILDSPQGTCIKSVIGFSSGFLVAIENAFLVYRSFKGDERMPFQKIGERSSILLNNKE